MNLLLDTCVLIDYLGRREPFFSDACRIIAAGYFGDAKLWVPGPSFKDAFYILGRQGDPAAIQRAFIKVAEVVTPVSLPPEDHVRAARLQWDDYEDCLVALCAERARADYLVTHDASGFARSSVPTLSPRAWAELMEQQGLAFDMIGPTD